MAFNLHKNRHKSYTRSNQVRYCSSQLSRKPRDQNGGQYDGPNREKSLGEYCEKIVAALDVRKTRDE